MEDYFINMGLSTLIMLLKAKDPAKMAKWKPAFVKLRDLLIAVFPIE